MAKSYSTILGLAFASIFLFASGGIALGFGLWGALKPSLPRFQTTCKCTNARMIDCDSYYCDEDYTCIMTMQVVGADFETTTSDDVEDFEQCEQLCEPDNPERCFYNEKKNAIFDSPKESKTLWWVLVTCFPPVCIGFAIFFAWLVCNMVASNKRHQASTARPIVTTTTAAASINQQGQDKEESAQPDKYQQPTPLDPKV
eukprot:TRINITY_DN39779_c0_g1_i1.p1 TRINITY_DN39779_c0_g1~~TRINITY_DN39779_c0_g1_i1.p1  ORF type:complete len:200 (-),score=32.57 TRINITY_DN39779_c0_g1_i1:38-637(-)